MPIASSDLHFRLSGGANNAAAALSIGGAKSTVNASAGIFGDVASIDAGSGQVDYRCVYVENTNASLTLVAPVLTIPTNTPSPTTTVDIGLGAAGLNANETPVTSALTAPSSVVFASTVALPDIPPGGFIAVWLRRTVNAGTVAVNDSFDIRVTGDTAA